MKSRMNSLLLAGALAGALTLSLVAQADDLKPIFNGKDLTGW